MLVEVKQKLVTTFDRSRGRFRALLQTVVARRVADELRAARPAALTDAARDALVAPPPAEVEAMDLEVALIQGVEACRDAFSGGALKDLDALHALTDRLVHGRSAKEIASAAGVSRDRIGRLLTRAREVIFTHLLASELDLDPAAPELPPFVDVFKRALRPGPTPWRPGGSWCLGAGRCCS